MQKTKIAYLKWRIGFDTVGVLSSNGSTIIVNPFVYVDTRVAKWVIRITGLKSVKSEISKVRKSEANLSAQNLKGFLSMQTFVWTSFKNPAGDSCTTCCTLKRVLRYSMKRFRKLMKCSAFLMLPGTTSATETLFYIRGWCCTTFLVYLFDQNA